MGKCNAQDLVDYVETNKDTLSSSVQRIIVNSIVGQDAMARISQALPFLKSEEERQAIRNAEAANTWLNEHHDASRKEGSGNMPIITSIKSALESRHATFFNDYSQEFRDDCDDNITNTFNDFKNKEENDINKLRNYMTSYLASYKSIYQYIKTLSDIKKGKINKLNEIKNKINTYQQNLNIDETKNKYVTENLNFYKHLHFYILIIYYSLIILYFIFSNFISSYGYKNKYLICFIVFYLLFPLLLPYLLNLIYKSYIFIMEYYNLKEETISYAYIIDE
jgi:hypothetical protein